MGNSTAFSQEQYERSYAQGVEAHFWNLARSAIIERCLRDELTGEETGSVLDVGAGVGLMVAYLRSRGFSCLGVELALSPVRPEVKPFVTTGVPAEKLPAHERSTIHTILLLDVLEHVQEPAMFLRNLRAAFPALRRMVIAVPAGMELWSAMDVEAGHLLRFDRRTLAQTGKDAGLRPVSIRHILQALYLPALLSSKSAQSRSIQAPKGLMVFAHKCVAQALALIDRLRIPLPGTSLLAVFEV